MNELYRIFVIYSPALTSALFVTLKLAAIAWSAGLIAGGLLAAIVTGLKLRAPGIAMDLLAFFLGATPPLVLLFWFYYPLQTLVNVSISGFTTTSIVLGLLNTAGVYKICVDAIRVFPSQYLSAAIVCGLNKYERFWLIVLPILVRSVLPQILLLQVMILQCTVFGSTISVNDLFRTAQRINSAEYQPIPIYTAMAAFYIVICAAISGIGLLIRRRNHYVSSEK